MPLVVGNIPTSNYSFGNPVQAFDSSGSVLLWYEDLLDTAPPSRVWYSKRSVSGDLRFHFTAYPGSDQRSGSGSRIDLREDQGGLIGDFVSIIPLLEPLKSETQLSIYLDWNLPQSPECPPAAWTWGDRISTKYVGSMDSAVYGLFAVGPFLQNMTSRITPTRGQEETFAMYWMGDLIYEQAFLFEKLSVLFTGMASFFSDTESFYKIFIRRSTVHSFGGSAFYRTFIIEYYPGMDWSYLDLFLVLSHEMAHNWPRLGECTEPNSMSKGILVSSPTDLLCDNETKWFNEGIAVYYGTLLPYRFGLCNGSIFADELNSNAQAYYTNSAINIPNKEAHERPWSGFDIIRMPYYRGFMYLVTLDAEIRRSSNGTRSVDDVVLELLARKNAGKHFGVDVFLSLVVPDVPDAVASYQAMASGKQLQIPASDCMASAGLMLRRVDMPPFEPGFQREQNATIGQIVKGSRAEEAGLRVGNRVLRTSDFNWLAARLDRNITVWIVRRGVEVEEEITYWPRARHTVEGYQWATSS